MKLIKYQFMQETNIGAEDEPNIVRNLEDKEILCADDTFESNYAIAQAEAYNGEIEVEDMPDPVPETEEHSVWDDMDAAYNAGYDEGYREGVTEAYDQ